VRFEFMVTTDVQALVSPEFVLDNISQTGHAYPLDLHNRPSYILSIIIVFSTIMYSTVKLFLHYAMRAYEGCGCIDPRILDLGTSCR
jgi:hypothetical protein